MPTKRVVEVALGTAYIDVAAIILFWFGSNIPVVNPVYFIGVAIGSFLVGITLIRKKGEEKWS